MKLVTSNQSKLSEFRRFGLELEMEEGLDLREVDGTSEEVVTYKAIEAGEHLIVEDTILIIDGEEVVDIKKRLDELDNWAGKPAEWRVSIGCLIGDQVVTSSASVIGQIKPPAPGFEDGFGFDPYFIPDGYEVSLEQLNRTGNKDTVSARRVAISQFLDKRNCKFLKLENIQPWEGGYQ